MDLNGKQVIAWKRGGPGVTPVIVIANFSEFQTPPGGEYVVPTWPQVAAEGKRWVEVTQSRTVEPAWIGREPLYSWEAKIYTLMDIPPAQRAA